jgi:hypothetical protein
MPKSCSKRKSERRVVAMESNKALWAKLLKAQAAIKPVAKEGKNQHFGYAYATAEDVLTEARRVLGEAGLVARRGAWTLGPLPEGLATKRDTNKDTGAVVEQNDGMITIAFDLIDPESGEMQTDVLPFPLVLERGKPLDKSLKAAITTAESDWLVGLLLIPRGGADVDVDGRGQADEEAPVGKPRDQPSGVTVGFGSAKGQDVAELSDQDLDWYFKAYRRDVEDPEKAKWAKRNMSVLDAILAERKRRSEAAPEPVDAAPAPSQPTLPDGPEFITPAQRRKLFSTAEAAAREAVNRDLTDQEVEDVKEIVKTELGAMGCKASTEIPRAKFDGVLARVAGAVKSAFAI